MSTDAEALAVRVADFIGHNGIDTSKVPMNEIVHGFFDAQMAAINVAADTAKRDLEQASAYTVILLYPDHATSDFGADTYITTEVAKDGYEAAKKAQVTASIANNSEIEPYDFRPVAVIEGDVVIELDATNF